MNYYNEWDEYAAQWLRNLIAAKLIPPGDVDQRDIRKVQPEDLRNFTQCHFFAGIGGWSLAFKLAGWPDDREVWTGSCPCQPFSVAGKAGGVGDERHLWPAFRGLIAERHPPIVFGEQVASADGRQWLAGVRVDLERDGYAIGGADLCAAGVGAPHIRQRLYWLAAADFPGSDRRARSGEQSLREQGAGTRGMADSKIAERGGANGASHAGRGSAETGGSGALGGMGNPSGVGLPRIDGRGAGEESEDRCKIGPLADTMSTGRPQRRPEPRNGSSSGRSCTRFWDVYGLIPCADGKARRVEPGSFPLAHGVPARMGRLRAYGNAIVPQVAAEFVKAYMEAIP